MCLIEEKSSIKPVASCAVNIANGMDIHTETTLVKKAREGVVEYLLINHPLDCPVCDQGGECDLQDQSLVFGADRGRYYEPKKAVQEKNLGFLIKTFLNRCIYCARCTRYLTELTNFEEISLLGRGETTEISAFVEKFLSSEVSGNIIDLCPVGALTSKSLAYKARPWELVSVYTFDIIEPYAANVEINYRGLEILRILPRINYEINEEWISDKTRFYYDSFFVQRLDAIYLLKKINGNYKLASWNLIFKLWKNLNFEKVKRYKKNCFVVNGKSFLFGDYNNLETIITCKNNYNFFSYQNNWEVIYDFRKNLYGSSANFGFFTKKNSDLKKIILLGVNPRFQSPVLNLKLKSLINEKRLEVLLLGVATNLNYNFTHISLTGNGKLACFFEKDSFAGNNFIICNTAKKNILNSEFINFYSVASSVSEICLHEVFYRKKWEGERKSCITFFLGQPENVRCHYNMKNMFFLKFYHHVEDTFLEEFGPYNGVKLPVKFYLEKTGAYFSESGYFFSTLTNIYGYSIRGTKEEWKILFALSEKLGLLLNKMLFKKINYRYGREVFFFFKKKTFKVFAVTEWITKSIVNNYYTTTVLSRLSLVLSLCAKKYTKLNDYSFSLGL